MKLFVLKSLAPDDGSLDGVGVSVYRTRADALAQFEANWNRWNDELGGDDDAAVNVAASVEVLEEFGYSEVLGTSYCLEEYELAD